MSTESERVIHDYLVELFGDNEGQVYAPTKGVTAKSWVRHFFSWPIQKQDIINHMIEANQVGKDVYIAPALFKNNTDATKKNWLGTQYIAVDFDGNAPQSESEIPQGLPSPTFKIQSSVPGREHWYWRLDQFYSGEDNRNTIEFVAKSVTYAFDADKSGWDSTQVLRAPGTKHRAKGVTARVLFHESSRVYTFTSFAEIPPAPVAEVELKIEENQLPSAMSVLANTSLSDVAKQIWERPLDEIHDRSNTLFAFAMECFEITPKMTRPEILSLVIELDRRLGKFTDRTDRWEKYKGLVVNAQKKHETRRVDAPIDEEYQDFRFMTIDEAFEQQVKPMNWLYDRFLIQGSLNVIASLGGVGKTSLMMQLGMCLATEHTFLTHEAKADRAISSVMFSFEMAEHYLNEYIRNLLSHFNEDQVARIKTNWRKAGMGYPVPLYNTKIQNFMAQQIDLFGSEVVFIDSVKYAGGMEEKHADAFFGWIKRDLIARRGLTVYLIHHIRKPSSEVRDKEPKGLEDLYGDTYIGNVADSVNFLYKEPGAESIKMKNVKSRSPIFEDRIIWRDEKQWYSEISGNESPIGPSIKDKNDPSASF